MLISWNIHSKKKIIFNKFTSTWAHCWCCIKLSLVTIGVYYFSVEDDLRVCFTQNKYSHMLGAVEHWFHEIRMKTVKVSTLSHPHSHQTESPASRLLYHRQQPSQKTFRVADVMGDGMKYRNIKWEPHNGQLGVKPYRS